MHAGRKAVYSCSLNLLNNLNTKIGELNKIKRVVKVFEKLAVAIPVL